MDKNGSGRKRSRNTELFILLSIFFFGMLLCASNTSPLYPYCYGDDSAIFTLIGKGIAGGKTVYRDLFDHKGPILFFIEALGYFLGKRTGIFILQCVFGMCNLAFLYAIRRTVQTEKRSVIDLILVFMTGYSVFFYTFLRGNLSEEYSLPFISGCLLLFVKYAAGTANTAKHPYRYSFAYGISFMSVALMRINNAITIVAGVLIIFIYLIGKKEYKNLFLNILFGLLGMCVIAVPIVWYFVAKGALYDMLYATFIYNFKYASSAAHQSLLRKIPRYIVLYSSFLCSVLCMALHFVKKKRLQLSDYIVSSVVLLNLVSLLMYNSFEHYFLLYMPVFVLVLCMYFQYNRRDILTWIIILCMLSHMFFAGKFFAHTVISNYIAKDTVSAYQEVSDITAQIPAQDRSSVIGYDIPSCYYLYADIVPAYKYYTLQKWWSENNPQITESFMDMLQSGGALWVLTLPEENDPTLLQILSDKYTRIDGNRTLNIYKLKE